MTEMQDKCANGKRFVDEIDSGIAENALAAFNEVILKQRGQEEFLKNHDWITCPESGEKFTSQPLQKKVEPLHTVRLNSIFSQ